MKNILLQQKPKRHSNKEQNCDYFAPFFNFYILLKNAKKYILWVGYLVDHTRPQFRIWRTDFSNNIGLYSLYYWD